MPKVNIKEIDNTSGGSIEYLDYTVLVPGNSTQTAGTTKLYTDLATFLSENQGGAVGWEANTGFKMAETLLSIGLPVQYVVYSDTLAATVFDAFIDKGLYDLRFITTGGVTNDGILEAAINCAATRGDAIALIDIATTGSTESQIVTSIKTTLNGLDVDPISREGGVSEDPFKYAAAFANKFKCAKYGSEELPGSLAYLCAFKNMLTRFNDWFAAAGSVRGQITLANAEPTLKFGDSVNNQLQVRVPDMSGSTAQTTRCANTISNIAPFGYIIWGNRTLLNVSATGLTASHFLNVRHLCCDIKKTLYRAARQYTFDANSDVLWANFTGAITPLLERMKSGQGIRGYKIVKEASDKKALLKAKIRIIPIEAVEDFDLTVELTDSIEVNE